MDMLIFSGYNKVHLGWEGGEWIGLDLTAISVIKGAFLAGWAWFI